MANRLLESIEENPIIAAVKDFEGLEECLHTDVSIVFVLFGDICNIGEIVDKIKKAGKIAIVHVDLIIGLGGKEVSIDFIKKTTKTDGIITTRQTLIKYAKELGLFTILRFFIIDSISLMNIEKQKNMVQPDIIEILPGVMPKIIKKISEISSVPVIAGGLVTDKEDVIGAISNGAIGISSTRKEVWGM